MTDISTRTFLAATCPQEEVMARMPEYPDDIRDKLIELGIIPKSARNKDPNFCCTDKAIQRLRCILRWEYADEMLLTYNKSRPQEE